MNRLTPEQQTLWSEIQDFEIDDPESDFLFSHRLCKENGWSLNYALRVIEEYKKFIFLICISDHPLTPSDQVDQVWHLHLIYTESYWKFLCEEILGKEIHHGPTKGGNKEKEKYEDLYERTKAKLVEVFEEEVPKDIWPSSEDRFGELSFSRVNKNRNWVIPKFFKN